jgi:hypothetical protein
MDLGFSVLEFEVEWMGWVLAMTWHVNGEGNLLQLERFI